MNIGNNSTVYIQFTGSTLPNKFELLRTIDGAEELEYERHLNGHTPRIKFNVVIGGDFLTNVPCKVVKVVPIEIPELDIELPPFERDRAKDVDVISIVKNMDLDGTPARIHTGSGVIELGRSLYNYTKPMRIFFILHELGHFYYSTEKYCDLFALVFFLRMGYNMSTAMYCLTKVLRHNPQNVERVLFIYNKLIKK
jgi:hypothetical protein